MTVPYWLQQALEKGGRGRYVAGPRFDSGLAKCSKTYKARLKEDNWMALIMMLVLKIVYGDERDSPHEMFLEDMHFKSSGCGQNIVKFELNLTATDALEASFNYLMNGNVASDEENVIAMETFGQ
ncbi:hypothetical protein scyTo_0004064 [Scyliorhinus torazame]|uniref:Uncharacterized protein n=1 Tax=Scyliorhinus torazame TaxID=75743 RepID=A0A401NK27_SCYTO|nr:hypothetical protein [Scyliorhinus torazame]